MRPPEQDSPADVALIDRIVDGGMTPEELRAAVSRLDITPDGWKRCAVAFLEGQALSKSFRGLGQPQKEKPAAQIVPFSMPEATKTACGIPVRFAMAWRRESSRLRSRSDGPLMERGLACSRIRILLARAFG